MSIETVDTGIFTHKNIVVTGKKELAAWRKADKENTFDVMVCECRKTAHRILKEHGIKLDDSGFPMTPSFPDPAIRDADIIIFYAHQMERCIYENNATAAAAAGLYLGMAATRLEVRPHEKPAVIGRKVIAGGKRGHKTADEGRYATNRINHARWKELAKEIPGTMRLKALKISTKTGANAETIRKALRKKS
jgi:hypothetical protein